MKIRKFNEDFEENKEDIKNISNDRVNEISKNMKDIISKVDVFGKELSDIYNEMSNFKTESEKNDQIDDIVLKLQTITKHLEDSKSDMDSVVTLLDDYSTNGRKYIY